MALRGLAERSKKGNLALEVTVSILVTVASLTYFHPIADKWPTDTLRWKPRHPESPQRERGS